MTTSHRRIALLTGASLAALGFATPSFALPHDAAGTGTNAGTSTSDTPIDICTIAAATPDCFFGVYHTGDGLVTSAVTGTANGEIIQVDTATSVDLVMTNAAGQTAEVGAIASATGNGNQTAQASITSGAIVQSANATTSDASNTFTNDGRLVVDAIAVASAATGNAIASATDSGGVWQYATVAAAATGTASNNFTNNGTYTAMASASAIAPEGKASAYASQDYGIYQYANNSGSGNAANTLTNDGAINIDAIAFASGSAASATANNYYGIEQFAYGGTDGDASNTLTNGALGSITIDANATAVAGTFGAFASASNYSAVRQSASATGTGDATNTLTNDGTISISANAKATGVTQATANAFQYYAIQQSAYADTGDASNTLTNNGNISIAANATGSASGGANSVEAYLYDGISQSATASAGGDASNTLTNGVGGVIDIGAVAHATAINTVTREGASATAYLYYGIYQNASAAGGDGNASNLLINDGAINIHATGSAEGGDAYADSVYVEYGIYQSADADGSGDATDSLTNNGTIDISALAHVVADTYDGEDATASVSNAIYQSAQAQTGTASVNLTGTGTLNISASASAVANDYASAVAEVEYGIYQFASATGGAASANLTQAAVNIDAHAFASAVGVIDNEGAEAFAYNYYGIEQYADAGGDEDATANISLGGGRIDATATAIGVNYFASAYASVYSAISQTASATGAGNASASLSNTGDLSINAIANATGETNANATAVNSYAIYQHATADSADATVTMTNTGNIDIGAAAKAFSATSSASAHANVYEAINQWAKATSGNALASMVVGGTDGSGGINIHATATASGSRVTAVDNASAYVSYGISQSATASNGGDATVSLTNNGTIEITANAKGVSTRDSVYATAYVYNGVTQTAHAYGGGDASITLANMGSFSIDANASATAETFAYANAYVESGIYQHAHATGGGNGVAQLTNSAALDIGAIANASGNSATAVATVSSGIYQSALGASATAALANATGGVIDIHATANATALVNDAHATASVGHVGGTEGGIYQFATATAGNALASVSNSGTMTVAASANANGVILASASANVFTGIYQSAIAGGGGATQGAASAVLVNTGTINLDANAHAVATSGAANAYASVEYGVWQIADGTATSIASFDNEGAFNVSALATATGTSAAVANATAYGVTQSASSAAFINGSAAAFLVNASANASAASGPATATAFAWGVGQYVGGGGTAQFSNAGSYSVHAHAVATGSTGAAKATADGYYASADVTGNGAAFGMTFVNSGTFNVTASATSPGTATAHAVGVSAVAVGSTPALATEEAALSGTINNTGTLHVAAIANGGGTYTTPTGGGGTTTVFLSQASATGINLTSGANTMVVTNSGTLSVDAVSNGSPVTATGLRVTGNGTGLVPAATDVFTFVNDGGTIQVRQSTDGGSTWVRGMAIDVSAAPNPSVINLLGDGNIYGNIDDGTADTINVQSGTTYFDGIINPEFLPVGGVTEADLDTGLFGEGTLNIDTGGNLILADPRITGDPTMYDGPAYAFVEDFNVGSDGTITYELQPATGGTQPVGTYPQIFTNTADITDGHLVALVTPAGGLFADNYFWDNVIDAEALTGEFADCSVGGAYAGSLLLDNLTCIYDGENNVDLGLERVEFNAPAGLNGNGTAVGTGLECIYSTSLTGGIANMLGDLFLFTNGANYNTALNQLSGSAYANYLQSFPSLGVHYNDLLDHATNCEVPALAGSVLECRASAPIHVWGQLDYQWRKADGDTEAGNTKSKRFTGLMGIDANMGNAAILGVSAGYVTNHTRDHQFGDNVDADGMQVGAYAVYDPGAFFVKGVTTYSWFDGDSRRHINFNGLATGATFTANPTGDPDVNMWTAGIHGGARLPMGGNSVVTPYLNYDYVDAKLKSFTEAGSSGAELTIENSHSRHSFLTGGVKWAGQMGGMVPEVNLGYRYRFGNSRSHFNGYFNGDTDCDFGIVSASQKRGTFLAGVSIGGKLGPVDLRIGYEGEFNGDVTSHSGNFKFVLPLGGHAAPPPPPPVVVAPPPPPPVVEVAPPPPPPPPPPPVERGERGQ